MGECNCKDPRPGVPLWGRSLCLSLLLWKTCENCWSLKFSCLIAEFRRTDLSGIRSSALACQNIRNIKYYRQWDGNWWVGAWPYGTDFPPFPLTMAESRPPCPAETWTVSVLQAFRVERKPSGRMISWVNSQPCKNPWSARKLIRVLLKDWFFSSPNLLLPVKKKIFFFSVTKARFWRPPSEWPRNPRIWVNANSSIVCSFFRLFV